MYVYTNSKVLSASQKNDEKKWYEEQFEDVDMEESMSEDEGGEDHGHGEETQERDPLFHDEHDAEYNMFNLVDEPPLNPHHNDEDFEADPLDVYNFQADEDDYECDEGVPSNATFVDGTRVLNSENVLAHSRDTNVAIEERNGTTIIIDGTSTLDEFVSISKCPSPIVVQAEGLDKQNDMEDSGVKVDQNVGDTSVAFVEVLACKNSNFASIEKAKARGVATHVDAGLMESASPMSFENGKGKKPLVRDPTLPPRSGPPRILTKTGKAFIAPSEDPVDDQTLEAMFGRRSLKSSDRTSLSLDVDGIIIPSGSKARQPESKKARSKRIMDAFATSPTKRQTLGRTPLDVCEPLSQSKVKPIHGFEKGIGKSLLRVRDMVKEPKKGKHKRLRATKQISGRKEQPVHSSSDSMESTSNEEDSEWDSRGHSSGAEVRGDVDYKP